MLPRVTGLQATGLVSEAGPVGDRTLLGRKVLALLPKGGGYVQLHVHIDYCSVLNKSSKMS